ncbi:methionyl-tRNA formyltransferase [Streptomyces sp. SID14478]|nr:formyltransferase family protein [Streptomyces sp. SID14478]NEB74290.1 methionyl-tRNA formyltransferase [Streptomyces sp. SID14478]
MSDVASAGRALTRVSRSGPLRIGVLVSATGANLQTLIDLQQQDPDSFAVSLVVSHGTRSPALAVARAHGIEAWPGDFDTRCGLASHSRDAQTRSLYRRRARAWHDDLNTRLIEWESANGPLDLVVLAYHRWIEGDLLTRYRGRMINQHPGDLSILDQAGQRALVGKDPVNSALTLGHASTRTSCFLVDASQDGGAVLCQGPAVPFEAEGPQPPDAWSHELRQKQLSDRPCLEWTVRAFAAGRLSLVEHQHNDGSPIVLVDGTAMPLGGKKLDHAAGSERS